MMRLHRSSFFIGFILISVIFCAFLFFTFNNRTQWKPSKNVSLIGSEGYESSHPSVSYHELLAAYDRLELKVDSIATLLNVSTSSDRIQSPGANVEYIPPGCDHRTGSKYLLVDSIKVPCDVRYKLVVIITSNSANFKRRQIIRKTWADRSAWNLPARTNLLVVFNLGLPVHVNNSTTIDKLMLRRTKAEAKQHGDMIIGNVTESFYHLSNKLSIALDWLYRHVNFNFVLKTDDDVYVNVGKLTTLLGNVPSHVKYFGRVMWRQPVERKGRYKLTLEEYKNDRFDPYCSGGGFIAGYEVIKKIARHLVFDSPLKYEDAYFGSLAYRVRIVPSFGYQDLFKMYNKRCEFSNNFILSHPVKRSSCMLHLHSNAIKFL